MKLLSTLPLAVGLLATSCIIVVDDGHRRRGSGVRVEEQRDVPSFSAIELDVPADATVTVGPEASLTLSGDDNVLRHVRTEVDGDVLEISLKGSWSLDAALRVTITTPHLERFSIDGSGDVTISGLEGAHFRGEIDGSGTLSARGRADSVEADIDGSGTIDLSGVHARKAHADIDGAGTIRVHATDFLHYDIDGAGDIVYAGSPEVRGEIDGAGNVTRR